ncbi:MAG TPA: hypothetical protein VNO30_16340 [Kofleriaceae bacterium]|nr:hypothetical protein [Kofleriaceae bacterium]
MRLGTCIALELALAAGAVVGAAVGVMHVSRLGGDYLAATEARAATPPAPAPAPVPPVVPLPSAELAVAPPAPPPPSVFGAPDAELLAPLGAAKVTRVKLNQGGSSLSLRLDFANGARAAFKPEQVHLQSEPRREIAAYRLDRLLGLGRVPPAKAGAFPLAELLAAADPATRGAVTERLTAEGRSRGGVLHGELSWWIPEIKYARIGSRNVDEPAGRALWISYLQVGARIPAEARPLVEQLAACVLFDTLTDNPDRWSGNNVMTSPDGQVFYIMDNTMSFSLARIGHDMNVGLLHRIQVFPRGLVQRMRALTEEQVKAALEGALEGGAGDTRLGPLLLPEEIHAVMERRDHIMKYIDQLVAVHGEQAVLGLP